MPKAANAHERKGAWPAHRYCLQNLPFCAWISMRVSPILSRTELVGSVSQSTRYGVLRLLDIQALEWVLRQDLEAALSGRLGLLVDEPAGRC